MNPLVWLLAGAFLALDAVSGAVVAFLDGWVRVSDRAGELLTSGFRAVLRGLRATGLFVLRLLGPFGRLLRRLWRVVVRVLRPPMAALLRQLRRGWEWLNVWVLQRMFRPMGRAFRWVYRRFPRTYARVRQAYIRLITKLEPLTRRLDAVVAAIERTAGRVKARLRRAWQPIAVAVAQWRSRR